jgi:hypothetical protein
VLIVSRVVLVAAVAGSERGRIGDETNERRQRRKRIDPKEEIEASGELFEALSARI